MQHAEVRYYYIHDEPYGVYYLGSTQLLLDHRMENKHICLPKNINSILEGELYLNLELSGLEYKNVGLKRMTAYTSKGDPMLCYFATDVDLRYTVLGYKRERLPKLPQSYKEETLHAWKVTPVAYLIPFKELCNLLVNQFLSVCTPREHLLVSECSHSLRFFFKEDSPQVLRLEAHVQPTYKRAPRDYVIMELHYLYATRLCFVKSSAWNQNRVTMDDVLYQRKLR